MAFTAVYDDSDRVYSGTLTTTDYDVVQLRGYYSAVEVLNRGTGAISFLLGSLPPATEAIETNSPVPSALGADNYVVLAGESVVVPVDNPSEYPIVALIGSADAYTVTGVR
jgi:hypothetical protein